MRDTRKIYNSYLISIVLVQSPYMAFVDLVRGSCSCSLAQQYSLKAHQDGENKNI